MIEDRDERAMTDGSSVSLTREGGDPSSRAKVSPATLEALSDVGVERHRQELIGVSKRLRGIEWRTCADPVMNDGTRYLVLGEEFGEIGNAVLERDYGGAKSNDDLRTELVQAAAVCVAWIEAIDASEPEPTPEPTPEPINLAQMRAFHAMCRDEDNYREQTSGTAKAFWKRRYGVEHTNHLTYDQAHRLLDELDLTLQELGAPRA